eukprot:gb/GFBE01017127.1/.p1 GENE.gb/GFBE01017127.1/~~gb/GFBE01017127.1/.p1  ORF type:complete len:279 (+),score=52.08 gb/GFBE01017127.1/:1-837(+)
MKPGDHPLAGRYDSAVTSQMTKPYIVLTGSGIVLLFMLCVMPMWSALELLQDFSFAYFNGQLVPGLMLGLCVSVLSSYYVVMSNFFRRAPVDELRGAMSITHMFVGLLGLVLVLMSFPLSWQASSAASAMAKCRGSEDTVQRLYEFSQVLQNIRGLPSCAMKLSVEECSGYSDAPPYTSFLKDMEKQFQCSGFCYQPSPESVQQAGSVKTGQGTAPPTLFSRADFEVPCQGMLARDMQNFAGDAATQIFYEGLFLLILACTVSCVKLAGFRSPKGIQL